MPLLGWTEDDVYLVADRAYSLYLQGRYREATVIFEGLVAVDPGNRYCALALAAAYLAAGEPQQALRCLDCWLATHAPDREARARRGEALLDLNRLEEAGQEWAVLRQGTSVPEARRFRLRLEAASANSSRREQPGARALDN